jgi:beta-carotene 15,15'-dioxygenase
MLRIVLLVSGFLVMLLQQYIQPLTAPIQFIIFFSGIVLLGIPHGAADLLVATKNAEGEKKSFSTILFFINYLGKLFLFGLTLWLFPVSGNLLFILFAAYHFGETDLHLFNTNNIAGKLFIVSYGLVILGVILLVHIDEMNSLIQQFDDYNKYIGIVNWMRLNNYIILSFLGLLFFISSFIYFFTQPAFIQNQGQFLIQFGIILFILFNLPMILGFTFYFVVWHSILSLTNIIKYLRKDGLLTNTIIAKQISIYSSIALVGIFLFGLTGFMFINTNAIMVYIFLGLAVLTAPHMQIMHNMYKNVRSH